jgi:hypothetical protein
MFKNLFNRVSRSRNTQPVTRRATFEPLEERRLCSVSPVEPSSFSLGASNPYSVTATATRLPVGQQPGGNNIIAILIG